AFGFGWTPCIGPVLGSILAISATGEGGTAGSVILLLSYSLGLAVPFLAAALATNRVLAGFNRIKPHLRTIQAASGVLLAGFGLLLVTDQITNLSAWFSDVLRSIGLDSLNEI
ncbi:MAG: cytochrome c biogenesis protein CcdA, partial [Acidimicrobiia bacterium]|nr:cytochrome c biogenesis protein CcdA [Acidimicrobiia bacterium]